MKSIQFLIILEYFILYCIIFLHSLVIKKYCCCTFYQILKLLRVINLFEIWQMGLSRLYLCTCCIILRGILFYFCIPGNFLCFHIVTSRLKMTSVTVSKRYYSVFSWPCLIFYSFFVLISDFVFRHIQVFNFSMRKIKRNDGISKSRTNKQI